MRHSASSLEKDEGWKLLFETIWKSSFEWSLAEERAAEGSTVYGESVRQTMTRRCTARACCLLWNPPPPYGKRARDAASPRERECAATL